MWLRSTDYNYLNEKMPTITAFVRLLTNFFSSAIKLSQFFFLQRRNLVNIVLKLSHATATNWLVSVRKNFNFHTNSHRFVRILTNFFLQRRNLVDIVLKHLHVTAINWLVSDRKNFNLHATTPTLTAFVRYYWQTFSSAIKT